MVDTTAPAQEGTSALKHLTAYTYSSSRERAQRRRCYLSTRRVGKGSE
ncbi:MAG: hypothetical protein AB9835_09840 [Eubacteriales bacterium]